VEVADISTPQTIEHWLAAEKGTIGIRNKLSARAFCDVAVRAFRSVICFLSATVSTLQKYWF
jgi:hypothetical protein